MPATGLDSRMEHIPPQKSNKEVGFRVLPLGSKPECSQLVGGGGGRDLAPRAGGRRGCRKGSCCIHIP